MNRQQLKAVFIVKRFFLCISLLLVAGTKIINMVREASHLKMAPDLLSDIMFS